MDSQAERFLADGGFGPVRFRFAAGPLDFRSWLKLQNRLMALAPKKRSLWRSVLGLVVGCLIGLPLGLGVAYVDASAMFVIVTQNPSWAWTLTDGALALGIIGAALLVYVFAIWQVILWRGRLARRFFDGAIDLHRSSEIILTEQGVLRSAESGLSFVRWSSVTELFSANGTLFLIADRALGYWIEERALGAEREAALAFIRSKLPKTA